MLRNVYDNDAIDFDFDIANMNLRIKEPEREPYGFNELARHQPYNHYKWQ